MTSARPPTRTAAATHESAPFWKDQEEEEPDTGSGVARRDSVLTTRARAVAATSPSAIPFQRARVPYHTLAEEMLTMEVADPPTGGEPLSTFHHRVLHRAHSFVSRTAKRTLPPGVVATLERRFALRRQLREWAASHEGQVGKLHRRDLEERIAERADVYERLLKDALEWNELILEELGRKIDRVGRRHQDQIRSLRAEIEELRAGIGTEEKAKERWQG